MILANTSATRTRRSSICLPVRIFPQKRTAFTLTPDRQLLMQARHRVVTVTRDERRLDKGNPEWKRVDDSLEEIALSCEELLRKDAEALEDEWNKPFWECIDRDLYASTCKLIGTNERTAEIEIFDRKLTLNGEDYGSACKSINGEEEYEYHVSLDEDNTKRLVVQIRREFGIDETLREVFQRAFGDSIISTRMMEYCRKYKIEYAFINY